MGWRKELHNLGEMFTKKFKNQFAEQQTQNIEMRMGWDGMADSLQLTMESVCE